LPSAVDVVSYTVVVVTIFNQEDRLCLSRGDVGTVIAILVREDEPDMELSFSLKEGFRGQGPVRFAATDPPGFLRVMAGPVGQRPEFSGFVRAAELDELKD
jgi:hypothetical protein